MILQKNLIAQAGQQECYGCLRDISHMRSRAIGKQAWYSFTCDAVGLQCDVQVSGWSGCRYCQAQHSNGRAGLPPLARAICQLSPHLLPHLCTTPTSCLCKLARHLIVATIKNSRAAGQARPSCCISRLSQAEAGTTTQCYTFTNGSTSCVSS